MDIKLNELTLDNIGSWPAPIRAAGIIVACLVLVIFVYWFDFRGQLGVLQESRDKETDLRQTFIVKQQSAANLNAYRQQLITVSLKFKNLLQQLPSQTEVPGLLEDISKTGIAEGLEFRLFKPLPEVQLDFYAELPIQIIVVGTYHQIAQFISQVASLNRIVTLHDFKITPFVKPEASTNQAQNGALTNTQQTKLTLEILAKTYRYTGEQKKKDDTKTDKKTQKK